MKDDASIGFGLEKLGYLSLRAPIVSLCLIVAFTLVVGLGIPRIETGQPVSQLFRSDTPEYATYEALSSRFPTSEFDAVVTVESTDLMRRETMFQLREFHLELRLLEPVASVLSMFSIYDPPDQSGDPVPVFPMEFPEGEAFGTLMNRVAVHPLIANRLLSDPDDRGQMALLLITLKPESIDRKRLGPAIERIEKAARELLEPAGMKATLFGVPVMQKEIRDAMVRDRRSLNAAGFIIGVLICWAYFRHLMLVLIASMAPALAFVWTLGFVGYATNGVSPALNMVPAVIIVIAFCDGLHMMAGVRKQLLLGCDPAEAVRHAIKTIGPACALTSVTTCLAFLSLMWTDSDLIRDFAGITAFCMIFAYLAVIVTIPTLSVLLIRSKQSYAPAAAGTGVIRLLNRVLDEACVQIGRLVEHRYRSITIFGLMLVTVFAVSFFQLEPRYRVDDQLPQNERTAQMMESAKRLEDKFGGANQLHIMVTWPAEQSLNAAEVQQAIAETHALLQAQTEIGDVGSIESLLQILRTDNPADSRSIGDYVEKLPDKLVGRFLNIRARTALVSGRIKNLSLEELASLLSRIESPLALLRDRHPQFEFTTTGIHVLTALRFNTMLPELYLSLVLAMTVVIAVIGLAFRSLFAAVISIIPNMFPILAVGAFLFVTDEGMKFISLMALTAAFGIAADDTIHFLNRYRRERNRTYSVAKAALQTLHHIGPVLIVTTLVLICGLSVALLSEIPVTRLFAELAVAALATALAADLVFLPASLILLSRLRGLQTWWEGIQCLNKFSPARHTLSPDKEETATNTQRNRQ